MNRRSRRWLLAGVPPAIVGGGLALLAGSVRPESWPAPPLVERGLVAPIEAATAELERLWQWRVERYLSAELWREEQAYNAGQLLQVPLHAAFFSGRREWMEQFAEQFARFMDNDDGVVPAASPLNKMNYLYLASRFVAICSRSGLGELVPAGLGERLNNQLDQLWFRKPAWMWDREPFHGGIAERVRWKLAAGRSRRSYYRAIIDQDMFPMAIAADLRQAQRSAGIELPRPEPVIDALELALAVFAQRVVPTGGGGWLMQPGLWTDHPDLAFAGTEHWTSGMAPVPVADIAEDSSHSHRYPLWLTSLLEAYPPGSAQRRFYEGLRGGLALQLLHQVLVPPDPEFPSYRLTNYLDGRNGWYRVGHPTLPPGTGYGPFELSGTFLLGWWSFLDHPLVCEAYREQAYLFPLPDRVVDVYVGPGGRAASSITMSDPSGLRTGLRLLLVMLAGSRCGPATETP